MKIHHIKYLLLVLTAISINACNCGRGKVKEGEKKPVYLYSFESSEQLSPANTKELVAKYLGINNVHDVTVSEDENTAYFVADDDVNTTLEQNLDNGNFAFSKLTKSYMGDLVPKLPGKEEALRIADSFLTSNGFAPKAAGQIRLVHSGGLRSQGMVDGRRAGPIVDKLITLTYGRVIDSLPVIGAGSKIVVNIGDKGEVVGLTRRWRELNAGEKKEIAAEEVYTQKEAEELAKRQIVTEFGSSAEFKIDKVYPSYYDNNGKYLQPVWAFETTLSLGKDRSIRPVKYLCVIQQLKKSPEPLNLTQVDPRAREAIKTVEPVKSTTPSRNPNSD